MKKIKQYFCKHKFHSFVGHTDGSKSQERKYYDDFEVKVCEKCGIEITNDL